MFGDDGVIMEGAEGDDVTEVQPQNGRVISPQRMRM